MQTNNAILSFIVNNFILIFLIVVSTLKIVPPEWAGFWKYNNNIEAQGKAPRINLIQLILHSLIDGVFRSFLISLLSAFGFQQMVTLVIFVVVVFDIFIQHQISAPAVTLVGIGIIALYLGKLIDTGKHIKLFGGLLEWKKNEEDKH